MPYKVLCVFYSILVRILYQQIGSCWHTHKSDTQTHTHKHKHKSKQICCFLGLLLIATGGTALSSWTVGLSAVVSSDGSRHVFH
jgi:hypothetical protein